MLCNVTGIMQLPDGSNAAGVRFALIPSVGGVVRADNISVAQDAVAFTVGQGGAVDFQAQSGEYVLRPTNRKFGDTVIYIPAMAAADVSQVMPVNVVNRGNKVYLKQGDTLSVNCIYVDDYDVARSLVGVTVTAAMQSPDGQVVTPLVVTKDTNESAGGFTISLDAANTASLAIGGHGCAVKFTAADDVTTTLSFKVNVVGEYE